MIEKKPLPEDAIPVRSRIPAPLSGRRVPVPVGGSGVVVPFSAATADSLLVVIWRNRWILLICVTVALAGGAIYIQTVTPIYTGTAKLYLDYTGIRISNPYEPGGIPQTDKYLHTQAEIIKSRPILGVATEALTSQRLRTFADVDIPIAYLHENMTVDIGKKDETIAISMRSPYPVEAAEIVNRVVETYMTSRSNHEQRNVAEILKTLQDAMSRARDELDKRQNALMDFRTKHMPLSLGSSQGEAAMQRYLEELRAAYTQAQIRTMDAESFRRAVRTLAEDPMALRQYIRLRGGAGAYVDMDQERNALEVKAVDLELQRANLLDSVTADHPRVVGLTAEVNRIGARLAELDDRFVKAVTVVAERQYIEAKSCEEQSARFYSQQQQQAVQSNAEIAQYDLFRLGVEAQTAYYQEREKEVREFQKIAGEDVGQLRMAILESAQPAETPSEPQKGRVLAMALVVGVLLGGGIAVTRDWLDQTLRSTDEISALLHVPVLGTVPAMSRRLRTPERGQRIHLQPDSHEAEAFRTIRTAVFFGAPKDGAKTMLVTSPTAGDGKSTLVSNLAIAIACAGQKTLVLDADFRKPTQHAIFELDCQERCLSALLAGRIKLAPAIQATSIKGLHVLTCGYGISSPAEVISSRLFARLLECLAQVYDRIVIDAPPITVVTDAQILAVLCDTTVLVLRADKSTRRAAQRAISALESVGVHLLGVVVNEVRRTGDRYGYYSGRNNRYYGSDSNNGGKSKPTHGGAAGQKPMGVPVGTASEKI